MVSSAKNRNRARDIGGNLATLDKFFTAGEKSSKRRLSMKVTPAFSSVLDELMETTKLNRTDLLKALVVEITNDIVKPARPSHLPELKTLAAVATG